MTGEDVDTAGDPWWRGTMSGVVAKAGGGGLHQDLVSTLL